MFEQLKQEIKREIKREILDALLKSYLKDLMNEEINSTPVAQRIVKIVRIGGATNGWYVYR